jgi:hypothetical protein
MRIWCIKIVDVLVLHIGEYWHELIVKMHELAIAFLQPASANIHQYKFNNPFII